MKAEHIKALEKANAVLLINSNAADATLAEVKLAFPSHPAITNQATEVCRALRKAARSTFDAEVKRLFIEAAKTNTISI
ncbi:hypothetical protein [Pseudomonas laurylsulfatiphila]|uniref:hypothetical protein n=1 Tax=Pseudomonas laurylsulfatiphila TaxID=2011015 RepID=UPI003D23325A